MVNNYVLFVSTEDETDVGMSMKVMLEGFISSLPNCVNRELIDSVSMKFIITAVTPDLELNIAPRIMFSRSTACWRR